MTTVERLSKVEFEQLSADEQSEHVQDALAALRKSIPHSAARRWSVCQEQPRSAKAACRSGRVPL